MTWTTLQVRAGIATRKQRIEKMRRSYLLYALLMLLPGEIADLSAAVERLSGYRRMTITEVKNA